MKARKINAMVWGAIILALAVHTLSNESEALIIGCTIFGHVLLFGMLCAVVDNYIKERAKQ